VLPRNLLESLVEVLRGEIVIGLRKVGVGDIGRGIVHPDVDRG
jgi:hypothetical protein